MMTEECLALGIQSIVFSGVFSLLEPCPFTEAQPCTRMQAVALGPLVSNDSRVQLPGPSLLGPAFRGCFILGRGGSTVDTPSLLGHCSPPSSGTGELVAQGFIVFPSRQVRWQIVPLHKHLSDVLPPRATEQVWRICSGAK